MRCEFEFSGVWRVEEGSVTLRFGLYLEGSVVDIHVHIKTQLAGARARAGAMPPGAPTQDVAVDRAMH